MELTKVVHETYYSLSNNNQIERRPLMAETQKNVIATLEAVLPKMSAETQSFLLGYGEGLAEGFKRREETDAKDKS